MKVANENACLFNKKSPGSSVRILTVGPRNEHKPLAS